MIKFEGENKNQNFDPYAILNIDRKATREQIIAARKRANKTN